MDDDSDDSLSITDGLSELGYNRDMQSGASSPVFVSQNGAEYPMLSSDDNMAQEDSDRRPESSPDVAAENNYAQIIADMTGLSPKDPPSKADIEFLKGRSNGYDCRYFNRRLIEAFKMKAASGQHVALFRAGYDAASARCPSPGSLNYHLVELRRQTLTFKRQARMITDVMNRCLAVSGKSQSLVRRAQKQLNKNNPKFHYAKRDQDVKFIVHVGANDANVGDGGDVEVLETLPPIPLRDHPVFDLDSNES